MPCPVSCLDELGCPDPMARIEDYSIFSPFVKLSFLKASGDEAAFITVGNESSPPNNQATITSFDYGFTPGSTGWGASFEIIDQGGSMYKQIVKAMNKTVANITDDALSLIFDFGWIAKNCNGDVPEPILSAYYLTRKRLTGAITKIDQSFEGGKIKLKFKLNGPGDKIPDTRHDDTKGDEDDKIGLRPALEELFRESKPSFNDIQFKNKDGEDNFEFKENKETGPLGAWPIQQQHSMSAARTWLNTIQTKENRGVLICYDPDTADIIFQEDKTNSGTCCAKNRRTYIVNGGNCTPVLEFNPSITWPVGLIAGGGAASASAASGNNGDDVSVKPLFEDNQGEIQDAGTQSSPTFQQHEWLWRTPEDLAAEAAEGFAVQLEANSIVEQPHGFTAELKLIGDPTYADPIAMIGETVSVVVISPFHLNDQCEWITTTNCSTILSNKRYQVLGVNHQIQAGSFVTTLSLKLPLPNKDIPYNQPLGGDSCSPSKDARFDDSPGASELQPANE